MESKIGTLGALVIQSPHLSGIYTTPPHLNLSPRRIVVSFRMKGSCRCRPEKRNPTTRKVEISRRRFASRNTGLEDHTILRHLFASCTSKPKSPKDLCGCLCEGGSRYYWEV